MALTTVPASLSATALTLTTAAQPNITSVGTLTGLTVSGNIAGTLTTAAQTNITSLGTLTGLTMSGNLNLNDDVILRLGTSNEFQIYHTSSGNSIISETGSGSLFIDGNNIYLRKDTSSGEAFADFIADGAAKLYHNGSKKFETTGSGISVTGGVTASRFDATTASTTDPVLQLTDSGVADYDFTFPDTSTIQLGTNTTSDKTFKLLNAGSGAFSLNVEGDIDATNVDASNTVYVGTNDSFFRENVVRFKSSGAAYFDHNTVGQDFIFRIGTSSTLDTTALVISDGTSTGYTLKVNGNIDIAQLKGSSGNAFLRFTDGDASADWSIGSDDGSGAGAGAFIIYDRSQSAYRAVINSSGRVGIRHTSPNAQLHINAGSNTAVTIGDATNPALQIGGTTNYRFGVYTDGETAYIENKNGDNGIAFRVKTAGEAMRLKTNGTITVGGDSYRFVDTVYRRTFNLNRAYTQVANINGSGLGSSYEVHVRGTTSSVVVNAHFHIMVGHYYDISIKSFGGAYTDCKVKVVSNGNEDSSLYIGCATVNNSTFNGLVSIRPHDTSAVDMSPSTAYSTCYVEHAQTTTATEETATGAATAGSGPTNAYS